MIVWDERKRQINLAKHDLDFADAQWVFANPEKITFDSHRGGEERQMDLAMVEAVGMILAFVYVHRGDTTRAISFRIASRRERKLYEKKRAELD